MRHFQPSRILVPVDFSPVSDRAVHLASMLAEKFGSLLTVLYADQFLPPPEMVELPRSLYARRLAELEEGAEERLKRYVALQVKGRLVSEALVEVEAADDAIVDVAEEKEIDLIVMGTHGRTGWRRVVFGSVAESVLRGTTRPVLTVPRGGRIGTPLSRIVCPVNYSDVAAAAVDHAATMANAFGAELVVVNVVESESASEGELQRLRDWMPSDLRDRCDYKELILTGHPAERIIEFAAELQADLLVIGAQHRLFFDDTVIGSTSEKVVRHAATPVLTVVRSLVAEDGADDEEEVVSASGPHAVI